MDMSTDEKDIREVIEEVVEEIPGMMVMTETETEEFLAKTLGNTKPETAAEALEQWDSGRTVWTVEMGGLGPGYEQAIHVTVMEIIRALKDRPFPEQDDKESFDEVLDLADIAIRDSNEPMTDGLTGAQAGAAKNLAFVTLRHGWAATMEREEVKDRLIQVSKRF